MCKEKLICGCGGKVIIFRELEGFWIGCLKCSIKITHKTKKQTITAFKLATRADVKQGIDPDKMKAFAEKWIAKSTTSMGVSLLNSANVKYGSSDDKLYDIDLDNVQWVNLSEIENLFKGLCAKFGKELLKEIGVPEINPPEK